MPHASTLLRRLWRVIAAVSALSLALWPGGTFARQAPAFSVYLPNVVSPGQLFLPLVARQPGTVLFNSSFESDGVVDYTIPIWPCRYDGEPENQAPQGNQIPDHWTYRAYGENELMPFPTKMQWGSLVEARSGGVGENIHKCQWMFPEDEYLGQPRALVLDGFWVYKIFSDHLPYAVQLSQVILGRPGESVEVTAYVLGETNAGEPLEDDHFVASLQVGSAADTRYYRSMRGIHDVPGNQRAWNRFRVVTQFPADGRLLVTITTQSNWAVPTDFFLDNFSARVLP
jgi:hypothetical protein